MESGLCVIGCDMSHSNKTWRTFMKLYTNFLVASATGRP